MKIQTREVKVGPIMIGTSSEVFTDKTTPWIQTNMTKEEQFAIIDQLWDMGVRSFDTSAVYGECMLGEYLKSRDRRWDATLMTKGGAPNDYRNRMLPFDILTDFFDSQIRLHRISFDIYMLQKDDPTIPVEDIVPVLDTMQKEGKIGIYGATDWSIERIKEANQFAHENGMTGFQAVSLHYSLAHQIQDPWGGGVSITGPEHEEDRKWLIEQNIPVFAYSPLSCGFLSGQFTSDDLEGAKNFLSEQGMKGYYASENFERLVRAEKLAEKYGVSVAQISFAWLVKQELKVIPIQVVENAQMYEQALKAFEIPLTAEEIKWLNLEV